MNSLPLLVTAGVGAPEGVRQRPEFRQTRQSLPLQVVADGDENEPVPRRVGVDRNELPMLVTAACHFRRVTVEIEQG